MGSLENGRCSFHNIGDNECLKILIAHTHESYFARYDVQESGLSESLFIQYLEKWHNIPMSRVLFHAHGLALKCRVGVVCSNGMDEQL